MALCVISKLKAFVGHDFLLRDLHLSHGVISVVLHGVNPLLGVGFRGGDIDNHSPVLVVLQEGSLDLGLDQFSPLESGLPVESGLPSLLLILLDLDQ